MAPLADFLRSRHAALNTPTPEPDLRHLERRLGIVLPDALREFYLAADGLAQPFGPWIWMFWKHTELLPLTEAFGPSVRLNSDIPDRPGSAFTHYLAFADVLIWAPVYAVDAHLSSPTFGEVVAIAGDRPPTVLLTTRSFERFSSLFTSQHDDLLVGDGPPPRRSEPPPSSPPMNLLRTLLQGFRRRSLPPAPDGFQWVVFDPGRVAFLAPVDYAMHREPDQTVAVYPPGDASGVTLRFSLRPEPLDPRLPDDGAERFLEAEAARRARPLSRLGDRLCFTETGTADWPDRQVRMHYWQLATGRILIVASATVWGPDPESATVQRALGLVPRLFESVRPV